MMVEFNHLLPAMPELGMGLPNDYHRWLPELPFSLPVAAQALRAIDTQLGARRRRRTPRFTEVVLNTSGVKREAGEQWPATGGQ